MADKTEAKPAAGQAPVKKKEKSVEKKAEKPAEKEKEQAGAEMQNGSAEKPEDAAVENGEFKLEQLDLPPLEVIAGDRIDPFSFKFQFRNVEYSSGRGKNFLCYLVDSQGDETRGPRGFLEAENMGPHAEEAFFPRVLPEHDPKVQYLVTWYVCSSPCTACAAKLIEILRARKSMRLVIYCARIFMWEEPEIQDGLRALAGAGCKIRMMKPADFVYIWDNFVESQAETFLPWEDCQDNFEYYEKRLAEILP